MLNNRDSLFKQTFSVPENFVDLYHACSGVRISPKDIVPFGLGSEHLRKPLTNDVSFLTADDKLIIIAEHQSTPNPNMPQREFLYYASLLHNWLVANGIELSQMKKIDVPMPEFYVVYNGKRGYNAKNLHFGNDFITINVKLINLNQQVEDGDLDMLDKQNMLVGYTYFYQQYDEAKDRGDTSEQAFAYATQQCEVHGYYTKMTERSDFKMTGPLLMTREEDLRWQGYYEGQEDGREEGREEGRGEGIAHSAEKLLLKGFVLGEIADMLDVPEEWLSHLLAKSSAVK